MRGAERSEHTYPVTSGFIPTISLYFNKGGVRTMAKRIAVKKKAMKKKATKKKAAKKKTAKKKATKKKTALTSTTCCAGALMRI